MNPDRFTQLDVIQLYDSDNKILWNQYGCKDCHNSGIYHIVSHVPHGSTDHQSDWGTGIPTTRRECSNCKRWDGPWVSSDIVGGFW